MTDVKSMDKIMALCKRRGFIYQASEIYGGINGFWDYGPLGAQLKKNLRDAWWEDVVMTGCRGATGPDGQPVRIVPLDTCIIQNPKVWEASGHVGGFNDPMVDDKETKQRFRADHLQGVFPFGQSPDAKLGGIPRWTVVASNPDEAVSILESDAKLRKQMGIISVHADHSKDDPFGRLLIVTTKQGEIQCMVDAVNQERLLDVAPETVPSPFTHKAGALTAPRQFNLMFFSYTGATASEEDKVYLRPETAQGIFINFKNVVDTTRVKVPFGIGQTGKAFRNEVTPRNFT